MSLLEKRCPGWNSLEFKGHSRYTIQSGEMRWIYPCSKGGLYFSETKAPFLEGLRPPLSRMLRVLMRSTTGGGSTRPVEYSRSPRTRSITG